MKKIVWLLSFCVWCGAAMAADHAVETQSKGRGVNRDRAIQNALYQAVCQVQGVKVSSSIATVDIKTGSYDSIYDPYTGSKKIDIENISADTAGTLAQAEAQGLVKSFEVVEEKEISPGLYEVSLKVWVYDYQSPLDTKKVRLAVMPFDATAASYQFGSTAVSPERLSEQVARLLSAMLAQNEKFTVLDRDTQSAILKEKKILMSDDAPLSEKVRLGEVLGADYMLVGAIPQAELIVEEETNPAIGVSSREFRAYVEMEYKVIVGPTRQVAFADQFRFKLEDDQVKALVEKWESDDIDYKALQQKLLERAAAQIADAVYDSLYPVRIAAVTPSGAVILSRGGKQFKEGDLFEIWKTGQDIVDPETGASLGKQEQQVAALKITKVLPKISYAAISQGVVSDAAVGSACRRVRVDDKLLLQSPAHRPTNIELTPSGGAKMPYDNRGPSQVIRSK